MTTPTPPTEVTIGLLGTGKIGSAIMTGFCSDNGWQPKHVYVSPRTKAKAEVLVAAFPDRVSIAVTNQEIVDKSDVIFVGLLPNVAKEELPKLHFDASKKVVSMMATVVYDDLLELLKMPQENVVRCVPLPNNAKRVGPIIAFPPRDFARTLLAQIGTPVMLETEKELATMTGMTALITYFFATCADLQQWCVSNGVDSDASRSYVASLFESLAVAGARSNDSFQDMAEEGATPGGINEQVHRGLLASGAYDLLVDQVDAVYKRLTGQDPAPRFQRQ